jgi:hypothetical protein
VTPMPRLTPLDELFIHQVPEPLPNVATHHEHWRESYFFVLHRPDHRLDADAGADDVLMLALAHYPAREEMDALQLGLVDGQHVFARHVRPYDGDPHTTAVGPVTVEVTEPLKTVHLRVSPDAEAPVSLDLTFRARTAAHALRRGTMKAGDEVVWDQSHMIQSGWYEGSYTADGVEQPVDGWWGQRDHSWGIRNHERCPMWMWLAIQLPDGMFGVWHWEYANGARVYTDGCFAPADGGEPIPVVDFTHALSWTDADGQPVDYGQDGSDVRGLAGRVSFTLEGGQVVTVDGEGTWAMPYGPLGGGQHQMVVRTDDGRSGTAIYEITGAHHHRYFPVARAERLPPG